jgi:hypothetical protein
MQETPTNPSTSTSSFLKHKHSRFPIQSPLYQTNLGNLCSICLEYDKYSLSKCIQCKQCNSYFHLNCYKQNSSSFQATDNNNFICYKCSYIHNTIDVPIPTCFLCSDTKGIIFQLKPSNKWCHVYCKRFFQETVQYETQSSPDGGGDVELRKWRYKSICKVCHCIIKNVPVIKCANKKCKNYYHINCAVQKNVIFNIAYQNDFFGINDVHMKSKVYPFYCNYHNRNLVNEYKEYLKQMDEVLKDNNTDNDNDNDEINKKENVIEIQTQVEFTVPAKVVEHDWYHGNSSNKENKGLSVNVNFDSEHKNTLSYGNSINVNDEFDFLDKLEQNGNSNGINNNNSESKILYSDTFGGDYFL